MAKQKKPRGIPPLEWAVAAFGALLVLATLVFFGREALRADVPPDLVAQVVAMRPVSDGWVADIRVENRGDLTAARVIIEGVSYEGEERSVTIEFVPGRSQRHAALMFANRPTRPPTIRVVSFGEP